MQHGLRGQAPVAIAATALQRVRIVGLYVQRLELREHMLAKRRSEVNVHDLGIALQRLGADLHARSGRAMARSGLRMMPTSPSPSLKFRTAGFPRYGFKASLSGRAFPSTSAVKPAPGMPASARGLQRPFAHFHTTC